MLRNFAAEETVRARSLHRRSLRFHRRMRILQRVSHSSARRTNRRALQTWSAGSPEMDAESSAIVDFAVRWLPFGGPPADDILVEFGISMLTFAQRIEKILVSGRPTGLSLAERNGLREMVAVVGRTAERG